MCNASYQKLFSNQNVCFYYGMKLNERIKFGNPNNDLDIDEVMELAQECFGELTEGCVLIGYTANERRKFMIRFAPNPMVSDALKDVLVPMVGWYGDPAQEE